MADDAKQLRETLAELHRQLEQAGSVTEELRTPLVQVLEDIRRALEAPQREAENPTLADRLERSALEFETTHPTIAGAINRLTHALSNMGI